MYAARTFLLLLLAAAFSSRSAAAGANRTRDTIPRISPGPICWDYRNAMGEEFLLKLRSLRLGPSSFLVSGALLGDEGNFPLFGNFESLDGKLKGNLELNASIPSVAKSEFISAVHFVVELDPESLDGDFEWISPTLSGPDPATRSFAAYSIGGVLAYRSAGRRCALDSGEPSGPGGAGL